MDGVLGTTADQYAIAAGRPEQNASPQTVPWNNTGVPAGTHRIIAVTSDGRHSQVTATSAGTVTLDDAGLALQLLGDGGHVTFANPILGSRTTFTLEMWIKLWYPPVSGAPQPSHNLIYVESYVGGGTYNGAQRHFTFVSLNNGDIPDDLPGATVMVSWPNDGVGPYPYTDPVPEGQWMHLAYVRAGSTLRIYIDGTLAAQGPEPTYTGPTPTDFHLGLLVNPVSGNEWGKFEVDELRVSSTARYSADFTPARVFVPDAATLSLWHFDELTGAAASDATGNEPDATLSPTVARVIADR